MRTTYPLLLCALAALPPSARAQDAPPATAPPATAPPVAAPPVAGAEAPKPKTIAIEKGEIRLDGRITALSGATAFDIKAFSFTSQAGKLIEFEDAKDKSIEGDEATRVYAGDDLEHPIGWKLIKLGMRVGIIGRDLGSGKPLHARAVVLSDFSSKYVKGRAMSAIHPVAILVARGRTEFEAQRFEESSKLFKEAASIASGASDASGAGLALTWLGSAYRELGQREKAIETLRQAMAILKGAGLESVSSTTLSNLGRALLEDKQAPEAIKTLLRADELSEGETEEVILSTRRALAAAYAADKQPEQALEVLRGLVGSYRALGQSEMEVALLLSQARLLTAQGKADEAASALALARERTEATTEAPKKAAALMSLGLYLAGARDKEGARASFNKAIDLFNAAGDARSVEQARRLLTMLDAPEAPATPGAAGATAPTVPTGATAPAEATAPPAAGSAAPAAPVAGQK